ncbi:MAG TPA: hypothetical protein VGL99_33950 [Chloroflexota bacterium]|jgi:hypothetical protein
MPRPSLVKAMLNSAPAAMRVTPVNGTDSAKRTKRHLAALVVCWSAHTAEVGAELIAGV